MRGVSVAILATGLAAGCCGPGPEKTTPAAEVTIPRAMTEVACGLATLRNEFSRLGVNTGNVLDTFDVTLVLKASADRTNELVVDARPSFEGVSPIGLTASDKLENVGSRENTIHLAFKNIYTAALNDPGKAQVRAHPIPIGPGPGAYAWVDKPCDSITPAVPVDVLRQIQRSGPR